MRIDDYRAQKLRDWVEQGVGFDMTTVLDLLDDREKLLLVQVSQKGIIKSYQKHLEKTEEELILRQTLLESEAAENDRLIKGMKEAEETIEAFEANERDLNAALRMSLERAEKAETRLREEEK